MQFGRTLKRLLLRISHANPPFGPTYMAKTGQWLYRLWLSTRSMTNLGAVFHTSDEAPRAAFPCALSLGWVESPPYFCTATETVADLMNAAGTNTPLHLHPF
jgi:hypothetical protein